MALTPITLPGDVAPCRDPVWAEFSCAGYRTTAPVVAEFTLVVTQQPDPGMQWQLALPNGTVVFEFVAGAADDSGAQITIGVDEAATRANIAAALAANPLTNALFTVVDSGGVITLTARTAGALAVGFNNTSPVTLAWVEATAGVAAVYAANYSANLQVWVERVWDSGEFFPLPAVDKRPDPSRRVAWDLHLLLKPELGYNWPAYTQSGILVTRALQRRYYLTHWEQYGTPAVPRRLYTTSTRLAWLAGSRKADHALMEQVFALTEATSIGTPFLTWLGRQGDREVGEDQHVWLSWRRNRAKVADEQFTVRAVIHYTDGTSSAAQTLWTDTNGSGWAIGDVGLWNVGFNHHDLADVDGTKEAHSYTITVRDQTNAVISEAYTLHVRYREASEQHIEWINSLGVVESTRGKGAWEMGMTVESELVDRWRTIVNEVPPSAQESDRMRLLVGGQRTLKVSTGLMDQSECEALCDLLLSPELRRVDHDRESRHPITLVDAQMVMARAGLGDEHLYALNLELLEADAELAWSNRPSLPDVPAPEPPPE